MKSHTYLGRKGIMVKLGWVKVIGEVKYRVLMESEKIKSVTTDRGCAADYANLG